MFLVVGLVLEGRASVTAPVDVMISGDGKPRHPQPCHYSPVFLHLHHPAGCVIVSLDEVADRHDEIGIKKIGVGDRLGENLDTFGRSAGPVTEDNEVKNVLTFRERERLI